MTFIGWCDICVGAWLLYWAIRASRSLLSGQRHSANPLILTHFMFCGVPAILNVVVGYPIYIFFTQFQLLDDPTVCAIYSVYVCACPVIWWYFGKARGDAGHATPGGTAITAAEYFRRFRFALYFVALLPLMLLMGAPNLEFYTSYGAVLGNTMTDGMATFHSFLSASTLFSILAIAAVWVSCQRLLPAVLAWLPMVGAAVWLNGKRHIVLIAIVMIVLVLWERRTLTGWKLLVCSMGAFAFFGVYSYIYQADLRSANLLEVAEQYDNFRIDYGRDHGIKFAIYSELHPEQDQILEYPGQSLLANLAAFVPRSVWPDKPWPYAMYATAADIGVAPQNLGWGITTSWLEEAVANFSWAGLLIGPFALALICRVGDSRQSRVADLLTVLFACLLLAVQFSAFAVIGVGWFVAVFGTGSPVGRAVGVPSDCRSN